MKEKGQLESVVLRDCLKVLRDFGSFCWRQNTGAFKVDNRFFRSSIAGVSDIIGVLPDGRFIAVECKRENGGRVSEKQRAFLDSVQKNGGVALVAHSGEYLRDFLERLEKSQ